MVSYSHWSSLLFDNGKEKKTRSEEFEIFLFHTYVKIWQENWFRSFFILNFDKSSRSMCRQTSESISTLITICYLFLYSLSLSSVLGLSSATSLPTCSISAPFVGRWIQPGLVDSITINNTWCSLKGTCLAAIGQQDVKNKFIFYNEYVTSFILLSFFC